jgi:integrase
MPVYKDETKKKNKYWYEFETGKDLITGKRNKIRKKGFSSEKEASAAMVKAMNEFNEGTFIEPSKMKLSVFLLESYLVARKKLATQTRIMYESYINNHIVNSSCGNEELAKLTGAHIQNLINELREKKLSENTVKKIYSILNTALKSAVRLKLIKENPSSLIIEIPKHTQSEIKVWNVEESIKFMSNSEGKSRYSFAFRLALMTGMRQGELLGLRWKDVDFNKKIIRITQTLSHNGKELKAGAKTKSSVRSIVFDDDTKIALLKQYNFIQSEKNLIEKNSGVEKYQDKDLVICTQYGSQCTPRNVMRTFYNLLKVIDVPKITFHNLRHTHATLLLLQNVNPKIVSERLGHASVKITLDIYSHLLPTIQEEAAKSISNIFGGHFGGQNTIEQNKLVEIKREAIL